MERTILIIDDDLDFQLMVSDVLRQRGYNVRSLLGGEPGVAIELAQKCDMVLLDIQLPGTNGLDMGAKLKSLPDTEKIPIIIISGHSEVDQLYKQSHADAFIQKPFSLTGLLVKINEMLPATA